MKNCHCAGSSYATRRVLLILFDLFSYLTHLILSFNILLLDLSKVLQGRLSIRLFQYCLFCRRGLDVVSPSAKLEHILPGSGIVKLKAEKLLHLFLLIRVSRVVELNVLDIVYSLASIDS